jgi:hypothetical protein
LIDEKKLKIFAKRFGGYEKVLIFAVPNKGKE